MKRIEMQAGEVYGRLTITHRVLGTKRTTYAATCECGKTIEADAVNIRRGNTQSCGCLIKDVSRDYCRRPLLQVIATQIGHYYKRNAKMRNLRWELDDATVTTLIQGACHYCGEIGVTETTTRSTCSSAKRRTMRNNGIDRIDNSIGYTKENAVTCCKHCNIAKSTMTVDDFLSWIGKVYRFNNK